MDARMAVPEREGAREPVNAQQVARTAGMEHALGDASAEAGDPQAVSRQRRAQDGEQVRDVTGITESHSTAGGRELGLRPA